MEAAGIIKPRGLGSRLGVGAAVVLIVLIGGRIIPSFTRNWLAKHGSKKLPIAFNKFDQISLAVGATALAYWVAFPENKASAFLCVIAGILHIWRLFRWAGEKTLTEPLVWILHAGYAFVPIGFLLISASILLPNEIQTSAALHAWTAGAVGVMTLAVMTRASLGHTGYLLHATHGTTVIYVLVFASAILRVAIGFGMESPQMLYLASTMWVVAFVVFVVLFGPILWKPKR